MARYGIRTERALGISLPFLRNLAREIVRKHGPDQALAEELWQSGVHEARILAALVGDPLEMSGDSMDR